MSRLIWIHKSSSCLIALTLFQSVSFSFCSLVHAEDTRESAEISASSLEGFEVSKLASLEKRFFEHDFPSDNLNDRLSRLEQLIFGSNIKGSFPERLKNLISKTSEAENKPAPISKPAVKPEKLTFESAMNSGIKNYESKRYHHAQSDFENALKLNPRSAEAYANLGGVLLMLHDKDNAKEAFKACFSLNPFGRLGTYAKEKILKIAEEEAYAKTNPQDSQTTVERTTKMIDRQVRDRARMYQEAAGRTSRHRISLYNKQIQKLTGDPYHDIDVQGRVRENQDVSDWNYIKSNWLRTDGMVQSNLALIDGNKKSASVFDSGASLKEQMLQPVSTPGGAKLRALGTSLYARYYGDGLPSTVDPPELVDPAPPALQATADSIITKRKAKGH